MLTYGTLSDLEGCNMTIDINKLDFDHYVNPDDNWLYDCLSLVYLTAQDIRFLVHHPRGDQLTALDEIIDYCEGKLPGLVATYQDLVEDGAVYYLDEDNYYQGGNADLYLTTMHVRFETVDFTE